jgi:hypothetical protein
MPGILRGLSVLAGFVLFMVGGVGSFIVWCNTDPEQWSPNGFTVLLAVGAFMLAVDLLIEERQAGHE